MKTLTPREVRETFSIQLKPSTKAQLKKLAEKSGMSLSAVLEHAAEELLKTVK